MQLLRRQWQAAFCWLTPKLTGKPAMNDPKETEQSQRPGFPVERLVGRFLSMAETREKTASDRRWARQGGEKEGYAAIAGLDAAAQAYRRCAREVQRAVKGEMPPPPDMRWDEAAEDTGDWWCSTCGLHVVAEDVTYEETHDPRHGGCGRDVKPNAELTGGFAATEKTDE